MDRGFVFAGAIPQDTDLLFPQRAALVSLAMLSQAVLGTATLVDGLAVAQNTVPALNVVVAAGSVYTLTTVDATPFGALAADTTHSILKQGIILDPTTLAITPPVTGGFSQVFLVQCQFQETDSIPVVLPYYNAANPAVPFSGPANAGTTQNTRRLGTVVLQLKAGTAAATGSQVAPTPDAGWTGLVNVTVANGATTIVNANIVALTPRRVSVALPDIPRLIGAVVTTASVNTTLTVDQAGLVLASASGGNRTITLPAANGAGTAIPLRFTFVRTDTSANTLAVAAGGADTIDGAASLALAVADRVTLVSDGVSAWKLASATAGRLLRRSIYSRVAGVLVVSVNGGATTATGAGTFTPIAGMASAVVGVQGGGGGGGGCTNPTGGLVSLGGPGASGAFGRSQFSAATIGASQAITVPVLAAGGSGAAGSAGGTASFGALLSAPGGPGGQIISSVTAPYSFGGNAASAAPTGANLQSILGSMGCPTLSVAATGVGSYGGQGGGTVFGPATIVTSGNTNGVSATTPGAGGSGAAVTSGFGPALGGDGAPGIIVVEEYS
jgi:hypothetical protein